MPTPPLRGHASAEGENMPSERRAGHATHEWAWLVAGVAAGALVFFAIAAPWPAYVWLKVPQALDIWRAESVDRSTGDFGHQEPIYFYVIRLPLLLAPWTVFFIHGLVVAARRVRREPAARARRSDQ